MTNGVDTTYGPIIRYTSPNSPFTQVVCQAPNPTAFDPSGSNGYGTTWCFAVAAAPVAGSGGCPSGASVQQTSALATAIAHLGNNTRLLFHCGETYTGNFVTFSGPVKFQIGAYGGCENTQTNRPIFNYTGAAGSPLFFIGSGTSYPSDGRITDIDMQSPTLFAMQVCITIGAVFAHIPTQITMNNLKCAGAQANYYWVGGAQMGLLNSVAVNQDGFIGTFVNVNGNGTTTYSSATPINNLNYQALIGNSLAGTGDLNTGGAGDETLRISACMFCVFSNNTLSDANPGGAVFKLFESNNNGGTDQGITGGSQPDYAGIPTQYVVVSDNSFLGLSGSFLTEVSPQNNCNDERFFDIVLERNIARESQNNQGVFMYISGERIAIRNNAFFVPSGFTNPVQFGIQMTGRTGPPYAGCPGGSGGPVTTPQLAQHIHVYNNSMESLSLHSAQMLFGFDNFSGIDANGAAAANSIGKNNLYHSTTTSGAVTFTDTGTGNVESNNTATAAIGNSPSFKNFSSSFNQMPDFKPTANFSGGVAVPGVIKDALGVIKTATVDLGAVTH